MNVPVSYGFNIPEPQRDTVMWHKVNCTDLNNYRMTMDNLFKSIDIPSCILSCNVLGCTDQNHIKAIEDLHNNIVNICISASVSSLPLKSQKPVKKVIPGWSAYVEPYRQSSMFWHVLWKENGCPRTAWIATLRNKSRASYHYALRYVKKTKDKIMVDRLAENVILNKCKDFWSVVKKVKGLKSCRANTIDNVTGNESIANHFLNNIKSCTIVLVMITYK